MVVVLLALLKVPDNRPVARSKIHFVSRSHFGSGDFVVVENWRHLCTTDFDHIPFNLKFFTKINFRNYYFFNF